MVKEIRHHGKARKEATTTTTAEIRGQMVNHHVSVVVDKITQIFKCRYKNFRCKNCGEVGHLIAVCESQKGEVNNKVKSYNNVKNMSEYVTEMRILKI